MPAKPRALRETEIAAQEDDDAEEQEEEALSAAEEKGELEEEKLFLLGKDKKPFVFRLPFAMDDLTLAARKAQILGAPEANVSSDALIMAHCRAMYDIFCTRPPKGFNVNKLRTWKSFIEMIEEVQGWHSTFLDALPED